jgi:hypothetical protein
MKKINLIIPIVISMINTVLAHAGEDDYGHHMMGGMYNMMYGGYGFGWMFLGWLIMILIIILLILLIIWLIKQIQKK